MPRTPADVKIPLPVAALELRANADKTRRRIQSGALAGGFEDGRWFVWRSALDAAKAARPASLRDAFNAATVAA